MKEAFGEGSTFVSYHPLLREPAHVAENPLGLGVGVPLVFLSPDADVADLRDPLAVLQRYHPPDRAVPAAVYAPEPLQRAVQWIAHALRRGFHVSQLPDHLPLDLGR